MSEPIQITVPEDLNEEDMLAAFSHPEFIKEVTDSLKGAGSKGDFAVSAVKNGPPFGLSKKKKSP